MVLPTPPHSNSHEKNFHLKPCPCLAVCFLKTFLYLQHPSGCPCRFLTATDISQLSEKAIQSGVRVGVSFVIQSLDGYVLLTKRPKTMRSFPNIWVTPGTYLASRIIKVKNDVKFHLGYFIGGHIEDGETVSLESCVICKLTAWL